MRIAFLTLSLILLGCASAPRPAEQRAACSDSHSSVALYEAGGPVSAPKVVRHVEPRGTGVMTEHPAVATVEAVVGADGVPTSVCFVSGDPIWGGAVANAVQRWRFEPARLDGQPVPVRVALTLPNLRGIYNPTYGICADGNLGCVGRVRPGLTDVPRGNTPGPVTN